MSFYEKSLQEGRKQDEAEVKQRCSFRYRAYSDPMGSSGRFSITRFFRPEAPGLIYQNFSQPCATGHPQGSVESIISQTSPVEVFPISQEQNYAESLPLAVNKCTCWGNEHLTLERGLQERQQQHLLCMMLKEPNHVHMISLKSTYKATYQRVPCKTAYFESLEVQNKWVTQLTCAEHLLCGTYHHAILIPLKKSTMSVILLLLFPSNLRHREVK